MINVDHIRPYYELDPVRFPGNENDSGDSSEPSESVDENEMPSETEQPHIVYEAEVKRLYKRQRGRTT